MFKFQKASDIWKECQSCGATTDNVEFQVTLKIRTDGDTQTAHVCTICGTQILGFLGAIESGIMELKGDEDE